MVICVAVDSNRGSRQETLKTQNSWVSKGNLGLTFLPHSTRLTPETNR